MLCNKVCSANTQVPCTEFMAVLSRIGLASLAFMGQNLALNIAGKWFPVSVSNWTMSKVNEMVEWAKQEGNLPLFGFQDPESFVRSIQNLVS